MSFTAFKKGYIEPVSMKNILPITLGFLFLLIGVIGIFLPILPTTPFVLISASCFAHNPKLAAWLQQSKLFSDYIINYKERTGLKKRTSIISLLFLWSMLGVSAGYIKMPWAYILLPCIRIAVTIHIFCISFPKKNPPKR